ncbi:hypothetical protein QTH91_01205 [Variovorax dokdonensis]|uniref:Transcriptional regulator n=1 Tax=Variovorax dokdonensis TaxID=344883 RepID=A0ABT7N586_9BURK|nr:hypothetical protein [Variovorax dokdonensis]MDM0043088.1 hypothetical protein [Variovorax dokdonensis]
MSVAILNLPSLASRGSERERALLSVLSESERELLLALLKRLHENLPEVELATQRYVQGRLSNDDGK